jgi:hypothetical protein
MFILFMGCDEIFCNSYPGALITGLPVGHTHEDIDQLFSVVARKLVGGLTRVLVELYTIDQLCDFLRAVFGSSPCVVEHVTAIYCPTELFSDFINPNLRGLGHTGWPIDSQGNPTHCIRFCQFVGAEETSVRLQYKRSECDVDWGPNYSLDLISGEWVPDANVVYTLITVEHSTHLLQNAPAISVGTPQAICLQTKILSCQHYLKNWELSTTDWWISFFSSTDTTISPWILASHQPQPPESIISLSYPQPQQISQMQEPLVCSNQASSAAWTLARKGAPCIITTLKINDVVLVAPDEGSVEEDKNAGYFLPVSFGKVTSVGDLLVDVEWLFAETFHSKFRPWIESYGPRKSTIHPDTIHTDPKGKVIKIEFTKASKLCAHSLKLIESLLSKEIFLNYK